jgi:hypothetical protein
MISKHRRIFRRSNRRRSKQQLNLNRRRQSKQGKIKKNWRKSKRGGRPVQIPVNALPELLNIPLEAIVSYRDSNQKGYKNEFSIKKREEPIADKFNLPNRQAALKNFQIELMNDVANDNKKITPELFRRIAEKHILNPLKHDQFNIKTEKDAWGRVYWLFYSPDLKEYMDAGFSKENLIRGGVDLSAVLSEDEYCSIIKGLTLEELVKILPLKTIKNCFKIDDIKDVYNYAQLKENYTLDEIKDAKLNLDSIMQTELDLQVIKYYGFTLPQIKEHYNKWEFLARSKWDEQFHHHLKDYFIKKLVNESENKELEKEKPFTINDLKDAGYEFKDIVVGSTIHRQNGAFKHSPSLAAKRFFEENQSLEYATTDGIIPLTHLKDAGYNLISGLNNNQNSSKFDLIDIFKKGKYKYRDIKDMYELYLKEDPKNPKLNEIKVELDKIAIEKCGKSKFTGTGARDNCVYELKKID